ncbi:FecR family protein [Pedobacter endophyticus]|uniref:FecR domain-containing protein n=1 Tax=Pedobacter endophyticus TaxID=2789740 RepID=A0A7U3Q6H8_9SPHI|nr:FecR domain-containing protein [Pedobacter endophyticus]QPH38707.1 FecR domain-containing protein [Pedobacter endophyticus]
MTMDDRSKYLFQRYLDNICSPKEWEELMGILENDEVLGNLFDETWNKNHGQINLQSSSPREHIRQAILERPKSRKPKKLLYYGLAAASLFGLFVLFQLISSNFRSFNSPVQKPLIQIADVDPGYSRAMLITGSGKKINLESLKINESMDLAGLKLHKLAEGWIKLETAADLYNQSLQNVIQTPKGGEFRITLSDGSEVMLNASTKFTFPARFSPQERSVSILGEGFFDVKNKDRAGKPQAPFVVHTLNHDVRVLGTAFNIQSYPGQSKDFTTLIRGVVKIGINNKEGKVLHPGEQAMVSTLGDIRVNKVDLEEVTAWKEGLFLFNDKPLEVLMEEISRWYDVDLLYVGKRKALELFGVYSRKKSLKSLLSNLEQTGKIKFEMLSNQNIKNKERRVTVRIKYL